MPGKNLLTFILISIFWISGMLENQILAQALDSAKTQINPNNKVSARLINKPNTIASEKAALRQLETELLGPIYISAITPDKMLQAYTTFVSKVKAKNKTWTASDWNNADAIMEKLNYRRNLLEHKIATSELIKIKALQIQYRTLETGQDAKELLSN